MSPHCVSPSACLICLIFPLIRYLRTLSAYPPHTVTLPPGPCGCHVAHDLHIKSGGVPLPCISLHLDLGITGTSRMSAHAISATLTPLASLQQESLDVELVLDHPIADDCHEQFVYLWIQSLHSSDGTAAPSFRDELGQAPAPPTTDAAAAPPPPPASSPASPDPYGDEGCIPYDEDDSLPSTIPYMGRSNDGYESPWWMDSGMSEADDDDDGRLVIDESPMSPVPASHKTDQDDTDDEEERSYYLQYYQRSLEDYRTILLPSQP